MFRSVPFASGNSFRSRFVLPLDIRSLRSPTWHPLDIRSLRFPAGHPLVTFSHLVSARSFVLVCLFHSVPFVSSNSFGIVSFRSRLFSHLTYTRSVLVRSPAWYPLVMFSHLVSPRSFVLTDLFARFRFVCPHKFVSLDSGYVLLVRHPLVTFSLSSVIDSGFVFCF